MKNLLSQIAHRAENVPPISSKELKHAIVRIKASKSLEPDGALIIPVCYKTMLKLILSSVRQQPLRELSAFSDPLLFSDLLS